METINFRNYRIVKDEKEIKGQMRPVARVFRETPKGKYSKEKMLWGYYYGTQEQRDKAISDFMAGIEARYADKEQQKVKMAELRANMVNPFKVGDLLYDSWGYDQTNIDFFQVVEVGKKSVKIRPIAEKYVRAAGWLCEYIAPEKDNFTGEAVSKNLVMGRNGQAYISSRWGGGLMKTTETEEHYQSHYA